MKGILAHSHAQAGEEAKPEPSRRQEQSESRLVRVLPACGSALWCWSLLRVSGAGAAAVDSCAGNAGRRGRTVWRTAGSGPSAVTNWLSVQLSAGKPASPGILPNYLG